MFLDILDHLLTRVEMRTVGLTEAEDVIPALEQALKENDPVDICILDIQMPSVSGYEVASNIHNHQDKRIVQTPLLAFSSSTTKRTRIYREAGFDGLEIHGPAKRLDYLIEFFSPATGEVTQ